MNSPDPLKKRNNRPPAEPGPAAAGSVRLLLGTIAGKIKPALSRKKYSAPLVISIALLWFYACPESTIIPVRGAVPGDWNPEFYWDCPWCTRYNKHMGIDIIKGEGTPVAAAANGMLIYSGWLGKYGRAVVMVSPKLRVHLYGHLNSFNNYLWPFVRQGTPIGLVGNTGTSDLPHLHYTVFSILPQVWLFEPRNMGWLKMFFLNPNVLLSHT